jgi:hypothetical protein
MTRVIRGARTTSFGWVIAAVVAVAVAALVASAVHLLPQLRNRLPRPPPTAASPCC